MNESKKDIGGEMMNSMYGILPSTNFRGTKVKIKINWGYSFKFKIPETKFQK
jgi:hypothetical protein